MSEKQYVDFVEFVVKSLVDNPNDVKVEKSVDEMGVLLSLNINPADMGYVIGRKGQNARAIRTLLRLVGARNNARVNLKIVEPEGSQRPPRREDREARQAVNTSSEEVDTSSIDDLKI
ncbi:MAG: KH domain-containing protein [Patescibacteria group bacterium]